MLVNIKVKVQHKKKSEICDYLKSIARIQTLLQTTKFVENVLVKLGIF